MHIPSTLVDEQMLAFIVAYQAQHGYAPSIRELRAHVGATQNYVWRHLRALEREGLIRLPPKGVPRGIVVTAPTAPVQAGAPASTASVRLDFVPAPRAETAPSEPIKIIEFRKPVPTTRRATKRTRRNGAR